MIIAEYKKRRVEEHAVLEKDNELLAKFTPEEAEDFDSGLVVQSEKIYNC